MQSSDIEMTAADALGAHEPGTSAMLALGS